MSATPNLTGPQLLTVLYADIHGYTGLIERNETATIAWLTRSLAMIRDLVADYGGAVVNTAGDGLVAVFQSVQQAMHFGLEMQREISQDRVWRDDHDPIAYRIGISMGDTFAGQDGVYGHSVNLAARIQGFAEPGGICVTDAVYQVLRNNADLAFEPLGAKQLKNISTPVEAYAVRRAAPEVLMPQAIARPSAPLAPLAANPLLPDASLAILPFDSLSSDPSDLHLARGLVADLITNLSRFRSLMVIAQRSAVYASAQGGSLHAIGRELGVRYLLTGSFRRSGQRLRISVELVEAASQTTIWSERYDGQLGEIFEFQDDVAAMTSTRVALQIDAAEQQRLAVLTHPSLYAYGLVLRGQDMGFRFRPESNLHARRLFEQAREIDPNYGRSYAAMSRTFNVEWRYNWSADPKASLNEALDLAKRAVQCDRMDSRGFSEMGLAHLYLKRHDEALAAYEHALELNPNDADLLAYMGDCLAYVGQGNRAVSLIERAMKLNPYFPDSYLWFLGDAYFHSGQYAEAIGALHRMQDQSEAHRLLAASHALLGNLDEAGHHAQEVMRVHPNFTVEHWRTVPPLQNIEDLDVYIEGLRRAGLN